MTIKWIKPDNFAGNKQLKQHGYIEYEGGMNRTLCSDKNYIVSDEFGDENIRERFDNLHRSKCYGITVKDVCMKCLRKLKGCDVSIHVEKELFSKLLSRDEVQFCVSIPFSTDNAIGAPCLINEHEKTVPTGYSMLAKILRVYNNEQDASKQDVVVQIEYSLC